MLSFYSTQDDHNYLINLPPYVDQSPEIQGYSSAALIEFRAKPTTL